MIRKPNGFPLHVRIMEMLKNMYGKICNLYTSLSTLAFDVKVSIQKSIEDNDLRSGQITLTTLDMKLDEMGSRILKAMEEKLNSVAGSRFVGRSVVDTEFADLSEVLDSSDVTNDICKSQSYVYHYSNLGKFLSVHDCYSFPKMCSLETA